MSAFSAAYIYANGGKKLLALFAQIGAPNIRALELNGEPVRGLNSLLKVVLPPPDED
ncbi:MAG: hypothetical protein LBI44_00320 [Oscillospiraceae bacterium]|jgi:hypothetical protein|nr:hypothetical protein [Oscillospiraceae bacterium]